MRRVPAVVRGRKPIVPGERRPLYRPGLAGRTSAGCHSSTSVVRSGRAAFSATERDDASFGMPRILLIKTSSLGDVVHNLPAVSDIARVFPGAEIDWVVEQAFAAVPSLHPAVGRVIPAAIRRWRRTWWRSAARAEVRAFVAALRRESYDGVVDTQGLLKSALVARCARGRRYGLDWRSSREPLRLFYDRTFDVPRSAHAVERNRSLAAAALGYTVSSQPSYGLRRLPRPSTLVGAAPYCVLIHGTTAAAKLWPETEWIECGCELARSGLRAMLPWGSDEERRRALRIAAGIPGAQALPQLGIDDLARILSNARCAVGVDTGLTHLATALGTIAVGIYTSTDPARVGLYGSACAVNLGGPGLCPRTHEVMRALERLAP